MMLRSACPGCVPLAISRREMLRTSALGFGSLALTGMLAENKTFANASGSDTHHRARAKNVIFCFMDGGVSHVDSFDPKPKLEQLDGKDVGKVDNPTANVNRKWLRSPWKFNKHGQSGMPVS